KIDLWFVVTAASVSVLPGPINSLNATTLTSAARAMTSNRLRITASRQSRKKNVDDVCYNMEVTSCLSLPRRTAYAVSTYHEIPHQPAHNRSLRAQHGPGLPGSWRGQGGRLRVLRAAAAAPARFSARRRAGGCPHLS